MGRDKRLRRARRAANQVAVELDRDGTAARVREAQAALLSPLLAEEFKVRCKGIPDTPAGWEKCTALLEAMLRERKVDMEGIAVQRSGLRNGATTFGCRPTALAVHLAAIRLEKKL